MKNSQYIYLSMIVLSVLLTCTNRTTTSDSKKITIGFSIATDTFILERWNKDINIFSSTAKELGAEVILQLSAGGTKEQIDQINYLLKQNINVLVVIAHDMEMIAGVIKQAHDAGIPVIAYDRMIMNVPIDAYISFDNEEVGRLFGKALTEKVPKGRYLIVNGSVRDNNSFLVHNGLMDILQPYVNRGAIQIVQDIWLQEWSYDEALEKIGKVFDSTTDIDAISCGNDQIASAAIQILSERRMAGKVAVVGQDADLISCQRVVEGTQLMTVYKPIAKLASRAAKLAIALASREAFPYDTLTDNKSGAMIASYIEKPIAVYKNTIDETIIKDGFHSKDDIYRNVPLVK
ncbi:substrate-binding domain-containing protein [Gracilinema caldarium]|uniref:D-xylose ABC transporter (Substrate-binding protein) n=1 Tax=Gracilinema caldarium (strain ATCC 51460 / DSM 7334 / H1) TaxID=744872 RepID=F8EWP3_GRAC1|nr:substrate-binding domain-containing protein [Gracilinema caldarium]AEJ18206.1 D-xylose ABC transporter (substrate-binding protein) [Gracilinema caldarium DSM 7334]